MYLVLSEIHTNQYDTDQTARMQFVGSLTARPIKNYYVFKLEQLSGNIISKYNNNNNNNNNDNYKNNNNKIYA